MKCVENPRAVSHGAAQSAPPRRRTNPGKIARRAGTTILALLFCVVWFFPVYWMIITAVKPRDEIMTTTPVFWPMHLSIVLSIIVAFFACTALTLYRFRGRKPIMVFVLAIQMTSGGIIPQIIIYNQLGLLNKYSGLILAYIAMVLPFAIWNMRGFFLNIPRTSSNPRPWKARTTGRSCGRSPSRWPRPASSRPRCSRSSTPGTTT